MRYLPNSDSDRAAMLNATGRSSVEEFFDRIPEELRLRGPLNLPGPLSEPEILEYFRQAAQRSAAGVRLASGRRGVYALRTRGRQRFTFAKRILHRLHAVPSGNCPRHAAGDV